MSRGVTAMLLKDVVDAVAAAIEILQRREFW